MSGYKVREKLHDGWAQVVDGASFGFINLLQARGSGGAHDAESFVKHFAPWKGGALESYYAVPNAKQPDFKLPEGDGSFSLPSPLTGDCPENNHTHLDVWLGPKGWQSPMMFLLHGMMSVSDIGYRMWARTLNRAGWSAIFFHLPYHYGRRPARVFSGEMSITSNLIRSAEGIRQAVIELRLICRLLRERGCPHVGLWGTSYGGWIAALLSVLESNISTVWLLEPIVDVDFAIWESPATLTMRRQLKARGITRELVRGYLPLFCPSYHTPKVAADHIILASGIFDRIATPESIRALHEKWEGSHYTEYRQGHVGYQLMPETLKLAKQKLPHLFAAEESRL